MGRVKDAILIAFLLLLCGYFYWHAPRHPTSSLSGKLPLAIAEPTPALERGSGLNLIAQAADFAAGSWRLRGVTLAPDAAVAPDGSKTAARLAETPGYDLHEIGTFAPGVTAGAVHTLSLFVKSAGSILIQFEMADKNPGKFGAVQFNLQEKTVVYEAGDVSGVGMQSLPDGWFRCWVAMPYSSDKAVFNFALMNTHAARTHRGNNSIGVLIWGVQFEPGARARAYAASQGGAAH
jgi:hypothetical protein